MVQYRSLISAFLCLSFSQSIVALSVEAPHPPTIIKGRLEVRTPDIGHVLGPVRNWEGAAPIAGIGFLPDDSLEVSIEYENGRHAGTVNRVNILVTNAKFAAPFYVGAGSGSTMITLSPGSTNVLGFTNVPESPAYYHGLPVMVPPSTSYTESAIWSYTASTGKLTPQWTNPDGSPGPTFLVYDARANALFFVADVDARNEYIPYYPVSAVDLYLVPL